jgi:hypothetical protein
MGTGGRWRSDADKRAGPARGTSAHANNAEYARRERESASRRSAQDTLRIRRTRTLPARSKKRGKRHTAHGTALATPSSVQRRLLRRQTYGEA